MRQLLCSLSAALLAACAVMPRVEARQAKAFDFAEIDKAVEAELKAGRTPGKVGRDRFGYERGEVLFVPDDSGAVEHIFMGLYAARRSR